MQSIKNCQVMMRVLLPGLISAQAASVAKAQPDPIQATPPQFAAPVPHAVQPAAEPAPVANILALPAAEKPAPLAPVAAVGPGNAGVEAATPATVIAQEQKLRQATELFRQGVGTAVEVDQAQAELIETQIRLAQAQAQPEDMVEKQVVENLAKVVATRENLVAVADARYKAGVMTLTEVNDVRIQLSEARIRLELHHLVGLRAENLAAMNALYKQGVVTRPKVDQASTALDAARSLTKKAEQTVVEQTAANQPVAVPAVD